MKPAYYNEIEPYAAQWIRNLIAAGHLPDGDVDTRSIADVQPEDLAGYAQCHFFAGIGGWALAARLAGWPDDREIWTGSCPCQPFSVAGKGAGADDDRHLWPHQFRLIRARRPAVWMGEQVAAAVGKSWLDGVHADLEGIGYACGAIVVPACAVDAPHRRDRLWLVADASVARLAQRVSLAGVPGEVGCEHQRQDAADDVAAGAVANATDERRAGERVLLRQEASRRVEGGVPEVAGSCPSGLRDPAARAGEEGAAANTNSISGQVDPHARGGEERSGAGQVTGPVRRGDGDVADPDSALTERGARPGAGPGEAQGGRPSGESHGHRHALPWDNAGWIIGHDGKARRVEPSIRLLAHGVPARVGRLRAYGNAIVPQVAAEVIGAYMDTLTETES